MTANPPENLFQTILVPVDGSQQAASALALAFGVAQKYNARIIVCNALEVRAIDTGQFFVVSDPDTVISDQMRRASEEIVAVATQSARKAGVTRVEAFVREGNPVQAILELARREKADLIVMGSHGHDGLKRLLLGSTTEGVIRRSAVPVLVVRQPDQAMREEPVECEEDSMLRSFEFAKALP